MTHVKRYDTDYDDDCLVPADMPRELLGQAIYRATYEHQGGDWRAVETKGFWYETADRLMAILQTQEPTT